MAKETSRWTGDPVGRRRSLMGETSASLPDEDDAGIADLEFGDGKACDERCKTGDETDAWRNDGV